LLEVVEEEPLLLPLGQVSVVLVAVGMAQRDQLPYRLQALRVPQIQVEGLEEALTTALQKPHQRQAAAA
jgi:hypothetical protein